MSALLDKMNQQFTDMHKLALDFEAMAQQAIIERDKARDRVTRLEGALKQLVVLGEEGMRPDPKEWITFHDKVAQVSRNALEGK